MALTSLPLSFSFLPSVLFVTLLSRCDRMTDGPNARFELLQIETVGALHADSTSSIFRANQKKKKKQITDAHVRGGNGIFSTASY